MKKLTGAVGLVVVAMAVTPSEAKTSADGTGRDDSEIKGKATQSADDQVRPSERFAQYYTNRRFRAPGGSGISSEPYVKDTHPKGPTWVNSPRGMDRLNPVVNPAFRNTFQKRQSY